MSPSTGPGPHPRGIEDQWHNISDDDTACSFLRQANRGEETVPTVAVGQQVLTNPSGAQVAALLPTRTRDAAQPGRRPGRASAWFTRLTGR